MYSLQQKVPTMCWDAPVLVFMEVYGVTSVLLSIRITRTPCKVDDFSINTKYIISTIF